MRTIISLIDIQLLVDSFYEKVRKDTLLGPIFNRQIEDRWPQHLERMYTFWQTVLLQEHTYHGSPFAPHMRLPIGEPHFTRWLQLFYKTIDENFEGSKAEEAKWRAQKMAEMFVVKIDYYQTRNSKPLL
ncbi:MAG: group III truncated hemoglobin [Bacteroidota bacterium]|jgi:hemoglobin|uniref:Globin n=1 Tax=Roseivirga thermotolerans TaxID=1758176 RepID=A0ABQ3I2S6_9BACT|nr:group III truncated hemoglobin [Roseivirga thermotolerans]MEC7752994.1 group III truncated hemoglobin [Bacteroidota bacterium]GHE52658.1 hypothetical protein GCM10011340_03750 [Roseivirga thermotolerans]